MKSNQSWSEIFPITSASLPSAPGIYKILLVDSKGFNGSPLSGLEAESILYIGKAEKSLASRDLNQHMTSGRTGSSTLRRSLGAVLKNALSLTALPRRDGRTSNYRFDSQGEERLTQWMRRYLSISWLICSCAEEARSIEPGYIISNKPVLNIDDNPEGEYRERMKKLRALCKEEAEAFVSGVNLGMNIKNGRSQMRNGKVEAVNQFLQQYMKQNGIKELDAVTAGELLDKAGILPDRPARPGMPLRRLLRGGFIEGAYQDTSRRWHIPWLPSKN